MARPPPSNDDPILRHRGVFEVAPSCRVLQIASSSDHKDIATRLDLGRLSILPTSSDFKRLTKSRQADDG
ncbi:hypothetical protein F01_550095 [Burkholderia cenocepacia]|nr:hypothetical protein F01_550095 [Burkholderia cenocepacia]